MGPRLKRHFSHFLGETTFLWPVPVLMLVTMWFVNPIGDFPLNDDWIYGKTVDQFLSTGIYERHPYGVPTALCQIMWGTLFAKVCGFSYTVLRMSTLVLSVIGACATGLCARACGCSKRVSLLCALVLFCNPIYMNLSFTFMTDVPYLTLSVLSIFWYLRGVKNWTAAELFWGGVFGALAFLVRQFGICIGIVFIAVFIYQIWRHKKPFNWSMLLACLLPWVVVFVFYLWWERHYGLEGGLGLVASSRSILDRLILTGSYITVIVSYMGLFVLPFNIPRLIAFRSTFKGYRPIQWTVLFLFCGGALVGFVAVQQSPLPILQNVLHDTGTGPLTLQDATYLNPDWKPFSLGWIWWVLTLLGIVSGGVLLADTVKICLSLFSRKTGSKFSLTQGQGLLLLLWAISIIGASWNPFLRTYLDRYTLTLVIPSILICAVGMGQLHTKISTKPLWALLVIFYGFSVCCTADYLTWNRTRWLAVDYLHTELEISPIKIDGGFEYNGLHTSDEFMRIHENYSFEEKGPLGWWVLDNEYAVSFLPRAGYREVKGFPYQSWFGFYEGTIRVLQREDVANGEY